MSHPDRTASRQNGKCAAYGCFCEGVMTNSTQGADDWYCSFHFNREAADTQAITVELNRLSWVICAIEGLKKHDFCEKEQAIFNDLADASECVELKQQPRESENMWMRRLYKVVEESIVNVLKP